MRALVFTSIALFSSAVDGVAIARFIHTDSDAIDKEDAQGTESINDSLSYRFPAAWREIFWNSNAAFQVSAGSLSAVRFEYVEELQLLSDRKSAPFAVGLEQAKRQDHFDEIQMQQFSFDGKISGPLWLGILGESDSHKEFGDLGIRLSWWDDSRHLVEFKYWSVDHYYNTKKSIKPDNRSTQTDSVEIMSYWTWNERDHLRLRYSQDQDLIWNRFSEGYIYDYRRQDIEAEVGVQISSSDTFSFATKNSQKREGKVGISAFEGQSKSMSRHHAENELKWQREVESTTMQFGFLNLNRNASYKQIGLGLPNQTSLEDLSPSRVSRQEQALYFVHHSPTSGFANFFQWGLYVDQVRLQRAEVENEIEAKFQTAYEFRHGKDAFVFFNVTWDLDRVVDHYPYADRHHPFNPWGGGHVQFMVAF